MRSADTPRFEIVAPAGDAADRRFVTLATFRTLTGISDGADATIEGLIDGVLSQCATYCKLARSGTAAPTFAREAVRATWGTTTMQRGTELLLPWRVPIAEITVEEAGTELEIGADFDVIDACTIRRLSGGAPTCWSGSGIVADYIAGWAVPPEPSGDPDGDPAPDDVVARIVDQVKLAYFQADADNSLRSEDFPGIWSGSYNVVGGSTIAKSGLLRSLEEVLTPFRNIVVG